MLSRLLSDLSCRYALAGQVRVVLEIYMSEMLSMKCWEK